MSDTMDREMYRDIFEQADVGIALNDPETGTVGKVNERYAELTGYSQEELRDMKIDAISADDPTFDQAAAMEKIQLAIDGQPQQFDWLFECKDGSTFWGEVALKRTTIEGQRRLLAFVRDITDRKQRERKLDQQNHRLEEFATVVSHDLRNPLYVIQGNIEMVREEYDDERLDAIARSADRMDTLIEDLLTLARDQEATPDVAPVALNEVVESCWQNVPTADASLCLQTSATIRADSGRLRQLLENLFANAVQYGGEDVRITVGDLADDPGFYIADDGPGISESERTAVLEVGHTSSEDGSGFGLSIVRQIAVGHGWDLSIADSLDGGARFEFSDVEVK